MGRAQFTCKRCLAQVGSNDLTDSLCHRCYAQQCEEAGAKEDHFHSAGEDELPELGEDRSGGKGREMLAEKGASSRLSAAQSEVVALREAIAKERRAKSAAAAALTEYSCSITPHPDHGLGVTIDADPSGNAFVDALVRIVEGLAPGAFPAGDQRHALVCLEIEDLDP